jgi:hypothetical protein
VIDLEQMRRDAVLLIGNVFPAGEPPSFAEMRNDHCPECQETAAIFTGKRWPELSFKDLTRNPPLSLLTPAAMHYYLPAVMVRSLEAERELDCVPGDLVSDLSPHDGKPSERQAACYRGFTPGQVRAILAFLRCRDVSEKLDVSQPDWEDEWVLAIPTGDKVLARAIEYWEKELARGVAV